MHAAGSAELNASRLRSSFPNYFGRPFNGLLEPILYDGMEILQKNEAFKKIDGEMKFSHVQVFVRQDGILYSGEWANHGRVSGLCFKQYTSTLLETVNPQHLNRVAFVSSSRELVKEHMKLGLKGIFTAIKHLHSLGIVHNDINPANIMLDKDGRLVLNDFDSCRYIRESLSNTGTKRTHQWHDPSVDLSLEKNDLDDFRELNIWLDESLTEGFLFE